MQKINKSTLSGTLYHTWYIYAVAAGLLTLLWLWAFMAYHQPKAHEKLEIYFSENLTSEKFLKDIHNKYDKKDLREVTPIYGNNTAKLKIGLNNADMFIFAKGNVESLPSDYYTPINSYIQEKLGVEDSQILNGKGVLLRQYGTPHYLDNYIEFGDMDYYIVFSSKSQNLGAAIKEDNAPHDHALTFAKYLIEGIE